MSFDTSDDTRRVETNANNDYSVPHVSKNVCTCNCTCKRRRSLKRGNLKQIVTTLADQWNGMSGVDSSVEINDANIDYNGLTYDDSNLEEDSMLAKVYQLPKYYPYLQTPPPPPPPLQQTNAQICIPPVIVTELSELQSRGQELSRMMELLQDSKTTLQEQLTNTINQFPPTNESFQPTFAQNKEMSPFVTDMQSESINASVTLPLQTSTAILNQTHRPRLLPDMNLKRGIIDRKQTKNDGKLNLISTAFINRIRDRIQRRENSARRLELQTDELHWTSTSMGDGVLFASDVIAFSSSNSARNQWVSESTETQRSKLNKTTQDNFSHRPIPRPQSWRHHSSEACDLRESLGSSLAALSLRSSPPPPPAPNFPGSPCFPVQSQHELLPRQSASPLAPRNANGLVSSGRTFAKRVNFCEQIDNSQEVNVAVDMISDSSACIKIKPAIKINRHRKVGDGDSEETYGLTNKSANQRTVAWIDEVASKDGKFDDEVDRYTE